MAQTLTQVGRYRIERELGRGAMGVVYKAFDPVVERMIAIKTIRLDVADSEELVQRLRREAKSVGQLEHPNIVALYDAGESAGLFYLAMQFIQGDTLQSRLKRQRWFTLKETQDLFRQICIGLDYAHQRGVIHRDIKPANIMITNDGVVKLTDFGIAKLAGTGSTATGLVIGTPSYMSPEQALGKALDGRSDIFSLGCILYEMITGETAFQGQNVTTVIYKIVHEAPTPLTALQPGLDPAVEAIVLRALSKRSEDRFQTCGEFATALELYLNKAAASIPKTRKADDLPSPLQGPVAPTPSTGPVGQAATTGSSGPATVVPAAVTTGQTAYGPVGIPFAWLGGGILGTLLLVVIILLLMQMRRPASNTGTSATQSISSNETSSPPPINAPQTTKESMPQSVATKPPIPASPVLQTTPAQIPQTTATGTSQPSIDLNAAQQPPRGARKGKAGILGWMAQKAVPVRNAVRGATSPIGDDSFDALLVKGDLAFRDGQYEKALDFYKKAYQLKSNSNEVRRKLATSLTLLGRPEEAQKYQ